MTWDARDLETDSALVRKGPILPDDALSPFAAVPLPEDAGYGDPILHGMPPVPDMVYDEYHWMDSLSPAERQAVAALGLMDMRRWSVWQQVITRGLEGMT